MDIAQFIGLAIAAIIAFALFLVLRAVVWWYWGIDKHLANQQTIIDLLNKQIELQQIIENQAAQRRMATPASQSHQPQSPTRPRSPLQP